MQRTYTGILTGDRIEWRGNAPPPTAQPIEVQVTLVEKPDERAARQARIGQILKELVRLNPFRDIEDPVAWQREIRKDRPLPGRD